MDDTLWLFKTKKATNMNNMKHEESKFYAIAFFMQLKKD